VNDSLENEGVRLAVAKEDCVEVGEGVRVEVGAIDGLGKGGTGVEVSTGNVLVGIISGWVTHMERLRQSPGNSMMKIMIKKRRM
jgi:hypothetical protein